MTRGRIASSFMALALVLMIAGAPRAEESADAGRFVARFTDDIIQRVIEPEINERERSRRLRTILTDNLAMESLGRFVLGRYWRRATKSQRASFQEVFTDALVVRFMPLLATYAGERVQVGQVRVAPNKPALITVTSQLVRPRGEPIGVTWRVRRDGQGYRVTDVVAEGISMAMILRSEYQAFVSQHSGRVSALIAALKERVGASLLVRHSASQK